MNFSKAFVLLLVVVTPLGASRDARPDLDGVSYHPSVRVQNRFAILDPDLSAPMGVGVHSPQVCGPSQSSEPIQIDEKVRPDRQETRRLTQCFAKVRSSGQKSPNSAIPMLIDVCRKAIEDGHVEGYDALGARAFSELGKRLSPKQEVTIFGETFDKEACFRRVLNDAQKKGDDAAKANALYRLLYASQGNQILLEGRLQSKCSQFMWILEAVGQTNLDLRALAWRGVLDYWQGPFIFIEGEELDLSDCLQRAYGAYLQAKSRDVKARCLVSVAKHVNTDLMYWDENTRKATILVRPFLLKRAAALTPHQTKRNRILMQYVESCLPGHVLSFTERTHQELVKILQAIASTCAQSDRGLYASAQDRIAYLEGLRQAQLCAHGPSSIVFTVDGLSDQDGSCQ